MEEVKMLTIKKLIEHYPALIAIFKQAKVKKATLFKGFDDMQRNNFNLLLEYETYSDKYNSSASLLSLEKPPFEVEALICEKSDMVSCYMVQLNADNSVELLLTEEQFEITQNELARIFGEAWIFNKIARLPSRMDVEEGYIQHCKDMGEWRSLFFPSKEESDSSEESISIQELSADELKKLWLGGSW